MSAPVFLLILLSVSLSGFAQVSFKLGVSSAATQAAMASGSIPSVLLAFAQSPAVIAGLAMYGVGTLIWLNVLSRMDLSQAYPFVGLSFLLTALLGYFLFHEPFHPGRIAGTALVIAGVVLVARS
ncbi:MAG TPA: EamA family transporter [Rhizomicrobium sp.]|jgi:drug/metabolite transporter (DMT)-like permease